MSDFDFTQDFAELAQLSAEINRESDSINEIIHGIEDKLRELNLGERTWLQKPIVPGDGVETADILLGFTRNEYTRQWELRVRYVPVAGAAQEQPLLDAARDIRLAAMAALPRLMNELKVRSLKTLEAIQAAKRIATK